MPGSGHRPTGQDRVGVAQGFGSLARVCRLLGPPHPVPRHGPTDPMRGSAAPGPRPARGAGGPASGPPGRRPAECRFSRLPALFLDDSEELSSLLSELTADPRCCQEILEIADAAAGPAAGRGSLAPTSVERETRFRRPSAESRHAFPSRGNPRQGDHGRFSGLSRGRLALAKETTATRVESPSPSPSVPSPRSVHADTPPTDS